MNVDFKSRLVFLINVAYKSKKISTFVFLYTYLLFVLIISHFLKIECLIRINCDLFNFLYNLNFKE